eukprot:CAMPEP_0184552274 /NCGR_PEP_ID=MMETSP0199_2-20130426/28409_1 /TAXON_ID=1112570 /ORGANISM="Thraustochytrium sp., Strain LLF1b" /LENGTH=587 /DNA_ID=CAMNT_0026947713 /DNA_START=100 /DNA_END=1860 /DNA_ORIENTATION=+
MVVSARRSVTRKSSAGKRSKAEPASPAKTSKGSKGAAKSTTKSAAKSAAKGGKRGRSAREEEEESSEEEEEVVASEQDGSASESGSDDELSREEAPKKMFEGSDESEEEDSGDEAEFQKAAFDGFKGKDLEDSESENDDDDEEAGLVDEEQLEDEEDQRVKDVMDIFRLGEGTEEDEDLDPETVNKRITEVLGFLSNWRKVAKEGRSRADFVEQLVRDCARYYGYLPTLIEMFLRLFSPQEMVEFLQANETPRPVVIRTNTLKARRRELAKTLTGRGVSLEPLADWSNVGLKVFESTVPIGATPEYLAGHYMLQSASSFAPVLALGPQPNERILDMASAPGGKTTYIAQLMKNTGMIVANDHNKDRISSTVANCARLGVRNVIHANHDGRAYPKVLGGFDRVLLDAPCSGLGVIQRDPSVKLSRTIEDIRATVLLQKQLLLAAIDSVDFKSKGGVVVYSTCSVAAEENECVVQYALEKRDVKLIDTGIEFGKPGITRYLDWRFHPSVKLTRRMYPHVHNMDGFFVAKFKKISNKIPSADPERQESTGKEDEDEKADSKERVQKEKFNIKGERKAKGSKRKGQSNNKP